MPWYEKNYIIETEQKKLNLTNVKLVLMMEKYVFKKSKKLIEK